MVKLAMSDKSPESSFDVAVKNYLGNFDPNYKARAIQILDDPKSSELDKQKALAYAKAYKIVIKAETESVSDETAICVDKNGRRIGLRRVH
jgi:hypothetical protein